MRSKSRSLRLRKRTKLNRRKRTQLKGGEVISSGHYGCVFEIDKKSVGKIQFMDINVYGDDKTFLKIQERIFDIDKTEKYFITTRDIIRLKHDNPQVIECYENWKNGSASGFTDISEFHIENSIKIDPDYSFKVFVQTKVQQCYPPHLWTLENKQHALRGLLMLHKIGFVHGDIKLENFGWKDGNPVYIDIDSARTPKTPEIFSTRDGLDILDLNYSEAGDLRDLGNTIN
jgi:serine/threonine protein kinase